VVNIQVTKVLQIVRDQVVADFTKICVGSLDVVDVWQAKTVGDLNALWAVWTILVLNHTCHDTLGGLGAATCFLALLQDL